MPVPLMGFLLQGFSPSQSLCPLSEAVTFVTLALDESENRANPKNHLVERVAFKALLSARIRHHPAMG
jgi:hypothetical protein